MNRIAGIINFDGTSVDFNDLDRMLNTMNYKEPDGQNIWIEEGVGLGCTQIGEMPGRHDDRMLSQRSGEPWVITFDGRIDNRQELFAILKSHVADISKPISDDELVLAAYEKWGQDCPKHLIGDFAFAIWDRVNHTLVCVRDHFGVKPLY
jgi:asparagine synthase (glutamine-hydrolysing)